MAKEFTFLGEIQRGWARFWRLSWWWKGPTFAVIVLILLMVVASVAAGPTEDSAVYPAGSLSITEPEDGVVVTSEEIVIRGTAPADAEIRRDVRNFGRDDRIKADKRGKWEYATSLDEGENSFEFFLQETKDVRVKLVVRYEPAGEPTTTPSGAPSTPSATPSPSPKPSATARPTLTTTPFPGIVDVTKLAGRSPEEVAHILGQPDEFGTFWSEDGKIGVKAGRLDAQQGDYWSGSITIIFINGGAQHITVEYSDGTKVDDALQLVGLPDAEPSSSAATAVRWRDVGGFYSARVMVDGGDAADIYLITEEQYEQTS